MSEENIHLLLIFLGIVVFSVAYIYAISKKVNKRLSNPEELLKNIDTELKDENIPNYSVVNDLKKAIKLNPQNKDLVLKLKELEDSDYKNTSPKNFYRVLAISITVLGLVHIYLWFNGTMNIYGVVFGIVFILISLLIFRQSLKEK